MWDSCGAAPLFDEAKTIMAMTPMLQRVVVVDPQPHSARFVVPATARAGIGVRIAG